ncbi:phage tail tape measure protein [Phyllobacterium sp. BT25]|uniref:Phage tail tape measure protein n=1 Tax=Phyllobacterium pellucidum TaxID=2740464 RepID=A0A849VLK5_9HYPH|nr:phage tail tape measure protein [Phyllobacterium pellucidum]NTS30186.1 phage tail tape measure protein [Phyllobacterium pellucidum]
MATEEFAVPLKITADGKSVENVLTNLEARSKQFGRTISDALKGAAVSGRNFEDVLRNLGMSLANMALGAGLAPLQKMASGWLEGLFNGLQGAKPHAKGGVVNSPTYFNDGGALGLMGEAGAEAIMPLARGADGKLGVVSQGGGAPLHVTFNVTTPDAASFRKSEAQMTGMLARAVQRGARTL